MPIVGGLDIHRKQITFDYFDTETGEVKRGQIAPADRVHLRALWVPITRSQALTCCLALTEEGQLRDLAARGSFARAL